MTTKVQNGRAISAPEKIVYWSVVGCGLFIPIFILWVRLKIIGPFLDPDQFKFVPLSGIVYGTDPTLFMRIMHNLTHPVFLLFYAVMFTWIGIGSLSRQLDKLSRQLRFVGLVAAHFLLLLSYYIAVNLPISDPVAVISAN
jgi:hypothetical protein